MPRSSASELAAVVAVTTVFGGWNGLPFLLDPGRTTWVEHVQGTEIEPTEVTPSLAELVSGPLALVVWGLLGVVIARAVGSRVLVIAAPLVGFVQMIIVTWTPVMPTRWLWPYTHSARYVGWLELADDGTGIGVASGFNVAATGWHVFYLVAVAALLAFVARYRQAVTKEISRAAKIAGLDPEGLASHSGRRTVVTALYADGGLDLADVARHVGHTDPSTTAGYVRSLGHRPTDTAARAAQLLDPTT